MPSSADGRFTWLRPTARAAPRSTGPLRDLVHLGEPRLDVARVDHEAAEGEPGVQFDVLGADHARVLHGALGGRRARRARGVQHATSWRRSARTSACTADGGRPRTSSWAVPSSSQPSPRPSACDQPGALDPEPGGAQGVVLALQEAQGPLGDLQGAFALPAEPAGDGGLGHQVEVAQRRGGRVAAAGRVRPRRSRRGAVSARTSSGAASHSSIARSRSRSCSE